MAQHHGRQDLQISRDVETLQSRIIEVLATINEEMLENIWREIEYRLDILRATNGAHVEVYE